MTAILIRRTSKPPLRFQGEKLAYADSRVVGGETQNRWREVTLYRTKAGRLVLHDEYVTQWQHERCTSDAHSFGNASELVEWLSTAQPRIHEAQQRAIERAAENDPSIAAAWGEDADREAA